MAARLFFLLLLSGMAMRAAGAATVSFRVSDGSGNALDSVALSLVPVARSGQTALRPRQIAQERKTFIPYMSVIQTGTPVEFPNNDTVRHHVYSFSPAKVFELKLYAGRPEKPVVFDKPGVVVLGCNIHDRMVAYVVVVDTPWSAVSGQDGSARIADLPPGEYRLQVWHPRQLGMADVPSRPIRVDGDMTEAVVVDFKK